jgi:hypothetical protein
MYAHPQYTQTALDEEKLPTTGPLSHDSFRAVDHIHHHTSRSRHSPDLIHPFSLRSLLEHRMCNVCTRPQTHDYVSPLTRCEPLVSNIRQGYTALTTSLNWAAFHPGSNRKCRLQYRSVVLLGEFPEQCRACMVAEPFPAYSSQHLNLKREAREENEETVRRA